MDELKQAAFLSKRVTDHLRLAQAEEDPKWTEKLSILEADSESVEKRVEQLVKELQANESTREPEGQDRGCLR